MKTVSYETRTEYITVQKGRYKCAGTGVGCLHGLGKGLPIYFVAQIDGRILGRWVVEVVSLPSLPKKGS